MPAGLSMVNPQSVKVNLSAATTATPDHEPTPPRP